MKMKTAICALLCATALPMAAQHTPVYPVSTPATVLYVHEDVTTHIVLPEKINLVDISTTAVAGDLCADNILRIKPVVEALDSLDDSTALAVVTLLGDRVMAQLELRHCDDPSRAVTAYQVHERDMSSWNNPRVSMPREVMSQLSWAVYTSGRRYHCVTSEANGLKAAVYNVYAMDGYFFIDYAVENKTSIPFEIADVRLRLADKRVAKATNSQTTELKPVYSLNTATSFKKYIRNVICIPRLTFPQDRVLELEIAETQISGRTIVLSLEYDDILHADGFDADVLSHTGTPRVLHINRSK